MTLLQLIQRLQAIKNTGSMLPLSKFIEELEVAQAILDEQPEPVPVAPVLVAIDPAADTVSAGSNTPADPGVEPPPPGSEAELLALSGQSPIIHNIDPYYIDTPAVETEPSIEAGGENDFTQQ